MAGCCSAVAHCPLSNSYFSEKPFPLREALYLGVPVGLGTDIAGGYSIDIMNSMRQAVAVSRISDGTRKLSSGEQSVAIDWKEALYLATRGGATALGLSCGVFQAGAPFDAQCSELCDYYKKITPKRTMLQSNCTKKATREWVRSISLSHSQVLHWVYWRSGGALETNGTGVAFGYRGRSWMRKVLQSTRSSSMYRYGYPELLGCKLRLLFVP
jgi:hypothetical protein